MRPTAATSILLAALGALALGGCGGGTQTVSVSSSTGAGGGATSGSAARSPRSSTTTAKTPSTPSTPAQSTRTATAPAFTKEASGGQSADATRASAVVRAHGYTPEDLGQYRSDQTLQVLVATRTGSADGYAQQAFFFLGGRYIGTDTSSPSAGIRLVSQGDTEATLAYRLYRPGDALCCARGGEATVRFQLNNGRLAALDPIPPVDSSTGASRR